MVGRVVEVMVGRLVPDMVVFWAMVRRLVGVVVGFSVCGIIGEMVGAVFLPPLSPCFCFLSFLPPLSSSFSVRRVIRAKVGIDFGYLLPPCCSLFLPSIPTFSSCSRWFMEWKRVNTGSWPATLFIINTKITKLINLCILLYIIKK